MVVEDADVVGDMEVSHMATEVVRIRLDKEEWTALLRVSEEDLRPTADQARFIIRQYLRRHGLIGTQEEQAIGACHK